MRAGPVADHHPGDPGVVGPFQEAADDGSLAGQIGVRRADDSVADPTRGPPSNRRLPESLNLGEELFLVRFIEGEIESQLHDHWILLASALFSCQFCERRNPGNLV